MFFQKNISSILPKINLGVETMIKLSFAKKGLCLIKGLRLLILEKIYKAMFIKGATFIREVRV